jgi:hypothetical protein
MLGAKDEASADAAGMIARAKAAAKKDAAGPGVSVLHQVTSLTPPPLKRPWGPARMHAHNDLPRSLAFPAWPLLLCHCRVSRGLLRALRLPSGTAQSCGHRQSA